MLVLTASRAIKGRIQSDLRRPESIESVAYSELTPVCFAPGTGDPADGRKADSDSERDDGCCCSSASDEESEADEAVEERAVDAELGAARVMTQALDARRRRKRFGCLLRVWQAVKTAYQCFQRRIKALVEHKYFQQGLLGAILINTLSMGIEYHNQVLRNFSRALITFDCCFF